LPEGKPGAVATVKGEIIGYPELNACTCNSVSNADTNEYSSSEIGVGFSSGESVDLVEIDFGFDLSLIAGTITVRLSAEDWNGNVGVADVTIVPQF